jgi:hypothetical protein
MKNFFSLSLLLFIYATSFGQEMQLLKTLNDFEIRYKVTKTEETEKHDKYVVEVVFRNISDKDIFYAGLPARSKHDEVTEEFIRIAVSGSVGMFSDSGVYLFGEATNLKAGDNRIMLVKAKKEYLSQSFFKTKKGEVPNFTVVPSGVVLKNSLMEFL